MLKHDPRLSYESMAKVLGVSVMTVRRDMGVLMENGAVEREGSRKSGSWRVVVSAE